MQEFCLGVGGGGGGGEVSKLICDPLCSKLIIMYTGDVERN